MPSPVVPQQNIDFNSSRQNAPIKPMTEVAAYEALWAIKNATFKTLAELFAKNPGARPSDLVDLDKIDEFRHLLKEILNGSSSKLNILISGTFDYPEKLKDAREPV